MPRAAGQVRLFGESYAAQRHRIGYVPQRTSVDWDFPVSALDVVAMGLYRKIGWFKPVSRKYRAAANQALDRVGMIVVLCAMSPSIDHVKWNTTN